MALIALKNIRKVYPNRVVALDGVDLEIPSGAIMALAGPSGCGKTTLLRVIAGLEPPTDGQVLFDGSDMATVEPMDRRIGMVFQNALLYPHLNVRDNLTFAVPKSNTDRQSLDHTIKETAGLLGIGNLLSRRPDELSGGQARRVAMGKAILRNPAILLLDEPLSHLDEPQREAICQIIVDLHRKRNLTTLYVTHDRREALAIADRICVMDQGRIQQIGTPREIREHPANRFVAEFFKEPKLFVENKRKG
jgi:multiple sugar transport system ATP-binding protein